MSGTCLHATAVAIDGAAVLLTGPSGSGKSDLALRLIDRGAILVCDDAVCLTVNGAPAVGIAPNIAGKLEVRGVGIVDLPYLATAPLRLLVQLGDDYDRLPENGATATLSGFAVPAVALSAFENSAVLKVEFALRQVIESDHWPQHIDASTTIESRNR
jgi:HPr kinase/phosphorylase